MVRLQRRLCVVCEPEGNTSLHRDQFSSQRWWSDVDALGSSPHRDSALFRSLNLLKRTTDLNVNGPLWVSALVPSVALSPLLLALVTSVHVRGFAATLCYILRLRGHLAAAV